MKTKRDLEAKAKALIGTSPDDAVKLYHKLWETHNEQFNEWDAYYTIKALRASRSPNLTWANELAEKYEDEKVGNLYGWLIFDRCVKGKNRNELIAKENFIATLPEFSPQKNLRIDDSYPCPTTISILSISKVYAKPSFNAIKIESFLSKLKIEYLSLKPGEPKNKEENDDEFASDFEKYCSLRTKALLKTEKFQECKKLSDLALKELTKFHYNNDTWFKMRIALSEDKLGNHQLSETLLQELLSSKAGNDKWFLYRDIADVFFEQCDFAKAWKFAVDAAYYGNEPHFLIGLYLLQVRILFKLERPSEGKILAELIAAIIKEQKWNDKIEYSKLFKYYQIDRQNLRTVNEIIKEAQNFWSTERYGNKAKLTGTVISIHKNGKVGRIKDQFGGIVDFHKKDLVIKIRSIENFKGAIVQFFVMKSFNGKNIAENITVKEQPANPKPNDLVGKTFNGTVKKVAEFGIFISMQGAPDGLLHKNSLPDNLKDNFKDVFTQGKKVRVIIERITEKGIQLKLIDNI